MSPMEWLQLSGLLFLAGLCLILIDTQAGGIMLAAALVAFIAAFTQQV